MHWEKLCQTKFNEILKAETLESQQAAGRRVSTSQAEGGWLISFSLSFLHLSGFCFVTHPPFSCRRSGELRDGRGRAGELHFYLFFFLPSDMGLWWCAFGMLPNWSENKAGGDSERKGASEHLEDVVNEILGFKNVCRRNRNTCVFNIIFWHCSEKKEH